MKSDAMIAARTATWSPEERATLAAVVGALRPSARHLNDVLDWIEDIAARQRVRPAAVLADRELETVLRTRGSAPDRLKRWKERLRRLRYPRLVAREAEIAELVGAMNLGSAVDVAAPAALEGGELTVTLRVRSAAELAGLLERLREKIASGEVERLFVLLDEA